MEDKIKYYWEQKRKFKSCKWDRLYNSELELINDLLKLKFDNIYNVPKGYEYLKSFQTYYNKNNTLTDKQLTQLKRLSEAMFEWFYIYNRQ